MQTSFTQFCGCSRGALRGEHQRPLKGSCFWTIISTVIRTIRVVALMAAWVMIALAQSSGAWKLVWSDEFNGPAGSSPDSNNWNYDLGGGGWGNGEAQLYTNSASNAFQDGKG